MRNQSLFAESKGYPALFTHSRSRERSWFTMISLALIGFLMIAVLAACGSDEDPTATTATTGGTVATATTGGTGTGGAGTSTPATTGTTGMTGSAEELGAIGECFYSNTTADVVNDLRGGDTSSAEDVYRSCLEDSLPPTLVGQLEPIIEQAAVCGEEAANNLSDAEVAALENGDEAVAERMTNETLECLSTEVGVDLSSL
jgi:hypothetical protein